MNFDILEAWYGQTDKDEEFLRRQNERSILNLGISFAILVPNQPPGLPRLNTRYLDFSNETWISDLILENFANMLEIV